MTAAEAAHKLLALAIRADKLKDDVTGGCSASGVILALGDVTGGT